MLITRVCGTLNKKRIPYAVVGGYAVCLHGSVRGTLDLDIITHHSKDNFIRLEKALTGLGFVSRHPISAAALYDHKDAYIKEKHLIAWNFFHTKRHEEQVDVIITHDIADITTTEIPMGDDSITVITLEDLVAMKKQCARDQDLLDVTALENIQAQLKT